MEIWKSLYMFAFIEKKYSENPTFLILRILELFTLEVCKILKTYANLWHILLFLNIWKQIFHISQVRTSETVNGVLM